MLDGADVRHHPDERKVEGGENRLGFVCRRLELRRLFDRDVEAVHHDACAQRLRLTAGAAGRVPVHGEARVDASRERRHSSGLAGGLLALVLGDDLDRREAARIPASPEALELLEIGEQRRRDVALDVQREPAPHRVEERDGHERVRALAHAPALRDGDPVPELPAGHVRRLDRGAKGCPAVLQTHLVPSYHDPVGATAHGRRRTR